MVIEKMAKKLPKYYPTMYLDGYEPYEILQAHRNKIREEYLSQNANEPFDINLIGKVSIKK